MTASVIFAYCDHIAHLITYSDLIGRPEWLETMITRTSAEAEPYFLPRDLKRTWTRALQLCTDRHSNHGEIFDPLMWQPDYDLIRFDILFDQYNDHRAGLECSIPTCDRPACKAYQLTDFGLLPIHHQEI